MPIADLSRCDDMPVMMLSLAGGGNSPHLEYQLLKRRALLTRWASTASKRPSIVVTAWLANAAYVLIPALILCLALVVLGLYRTRLHHG
jgi:hypothetical protein